MLAVVPQSAWGAVCRLGSRTVLEGRDAVLDIRLAHRMVRDETGAMERISGVTCTL
jgi:hypothetical protein